MEDHTASRLDKLALHRTVDVPDRRPRSQEAEQFFAACGGWDHVRTVRVAVRADLRRGACEKRAVCRAQPPLRELRSIGKHHQVCTSRQDERPAHKVGGGREKVGVICNVQESKSRGSHTVRFGAVGWGENR